ncbi:MAG: AraC family transcriptional regulator [Clostridiales bacterium]|nr:AraC family transcriptional regulator [Clostridiales bacterium]
MTDAENSSRNVNKRRFYVAESNTVRDYSHSHTSLALTYIIHGEADHVINGEFTRISDGNYFIIDLGSWHSCRVLSGSISLINIIFTAGIIDRSLPETTGVGDLLSSPAFALPSGKGKFGIADRVFHDSDLEIGMLFSRALQECQKGDLCWKSIVRGLISEILISMVRKVSLPETGNPGMDIVFNCKTYITEHFSENLTLSDICKKLGYSVPYVSSKFRETVGMTFSQYLQKERINRSRALLLCTNLSVEEICARVGYHNSTFFYRIFKKETGVSPREYRSSHEHLR